MTIEEVNKIVEPHQAYLDSLSDDKALTAINFIKDNPDCSTEVVKQSVEIQHS
jgi:hypothetical protein